MKTADKRQALLLHEQLLQEFGGTAGIRDDGLLESALAAPFQTFGGQACTLRCRLRRHSLGSGWFATIPLWTATNVSALM